MKLHFKFHRLDPDVGGYMSVHVGEGHDFLVLTTPISTAAEEEHRKTLNAKIAVIEEKNKKG